MGASLGFASTVSFQVLLTASCLVLVAGCSDPQADMRAKLCKEAGVTTDLVKECKRSEVEYNRIMEPIRARQEREEIAVFNATLHALPSRIVPKDRYESISLEKLNKEHSGLDLIEESKMAQHVLFGKRFRVRGEIRYHPTDYENKLEDHLSLMDETNGYLNVDTESLSREERAFVRNQCNFDACQGEFFGVMGVARRDQVQSLGLQIEYMKISPRELKKSS